MLRGLPALECCSAPNLDPTVSCKINELGRRSASNLRADQQAANASDVTQAGALLHGAETTAWGDAGYQGVEKRPEHRDGGVEWRVAMKPGRRRLLGEGVAEEAAEKRKASVRAKVEHPFLYVKRHFGYAKVRYRGVAKNRQRIALLLGFSNLLIAGRYATG